MILRTIFTNYLNQKQFDEKGYLVLENFFQSSEVKQLQNIYSNIQTPFAISSSFYTTHWVNDKKYREDVDRAVSEVLNNKVLAIFNNYKNIFGYFLTKTGLPENEVSVHRDWSIVDETYYTGINAWIPLCNTDADNGCFQLVEGSHLNYNRVRGSNIEIDYESEKQQGNLKSIFLKAGDLLLFNQKLLHASPANKTNSTRIAAGMVLIPAETAPLHFTFAEADSSFYRLAMPDNFLVESCFNRLNTKLLAAQMLEICLQKTKLKAMPVIIQPERQIFTNPDYDSEIYNKGMFTMSLLSEQQIQDCLSVYNNVHSGLDDKFYNTMASNNLDYRKQVNAQLEAILGDTLRPLFDRYKVLAYNFAAKTYGVGSNCNIHNDDSHADEAIHTCINVWIPLVNVGDKNGSLYVLPYSHKLPYSIRGIGLPFEYENYKSIIEPFLKVMTMKAGEALFFDSRLIHGSYENKLEQDRPAIILAMLPEEAEPLVYMTHRGMPKDYAELFEAPSDFYLNIKIGERPDNYKSRGVFRFTMADIPKEEFLSIINGC